MLAILPSTHCVSPQEALDNMNQMNSKNTFGIDQEEIRRAVYQRPFQYLRKFSCDASVDNLDNFYYEKPEGTEEECLRVLLNYCSLEDPTWYELWQFSSFLNCQLEDCEQSIYCNTGRFGEECRLVGFKSFVVKFMIRMSQDFATPSPSLKDHQPSLVVEENLVLEKHQVRRRWEDSVHPCLFFHEDRMSMSFINFKINKNGDLLCPKSNMCLEKKIMSPELLEGLKKYKFNFDESLDEMSRDEKLNVLRQVFGLPNGPDPDPTYELTTDNVVKMLAIHMRFRCNIPVVIMGETGCGKTRMVEFMSKLKTVKQKFGKFKDTDSTSVQAESDTGNDTKVLEAMEQDVETSQDTDKQKAYKQKVAKCVQADGGKVENMSVKAAGGKVENMSVQAEGGKVENMSVQAEGGKVENMMVFKVHGGITVRDVQKYLREALQLAKNNQAHHKPPTIRRRAFELARDDKQRERIAKILDKFLKFAGAYEILHNIDKLVENAVKLVHDHHLYQNVDKVLTTALELATDLKKWPNFEVALKKSIEHVAHHQTSQLGDSVVLGADDHNSNIRSVASVQPQATGLFKMSMFKFWSVYRKKTMVDREQRTLSRVLSDEDVLLSAVKLPSGFHTILFVDEANATEAIYALKEFVCDGSIQGTIVENCGLQVIAACNPYRKLGEEAITTMEEAGLGFRVKSEKSNDRFGNIPMRFLVYRVIPLPPSMLSFVWDFGQLQMDAEKLYIKLMVQRLQHSAKRIRSRYVDLIVDVLETSQMYMRENRSICRFVSLRDVERCFVSFSWFLENSDWLCTETDKALEMRAVDKNVKLPTIVRCLIHAVGMCYHVTLKNRGEYRRLVSKTICKLGVEVSEEDILEEIIACQSVFLANIDLDDKVARNEALRENVFMIIMCTEMRIPLFLIGKPGSSKSLAKTLVTTTMQGLNSSKPVFRKLKEIHTVSFQCSPVTDPSGIKSVFEQCLKLQSKRESKKYVAVAVLDEIGLAEDSLKMPLKLLHSFLESSSADEPKVGLSGLVDQQINNHEKTGFLGISNWALDPAKMNRGIFVQRSEPSESDLLVTGKKICGSIKNLEKVVEVVAKSYVSIMNEQRIHIQTFARSGQIKTEFFGLRDYYGLLKMIATIAMSSKSVAASHLAYAIQRNFSGSPKDYTFVWKNVESLYPDLLQHSVPLQQMLKDNLDCAYNFESRYLLLMSNPVAGITLLNKVVGKEANFEIIFGSSFPQDNNYTEVCRNINRIKICMESGRTIVLLNLKHLYESLYDALNQHYVTFAGQRYVDLGLGGHIVKCRVAKNFRLIVIEDRNVVYNEFPIPLINRLEKHTFTTSSILQPDQKKNEEQLHNWATAFSSMNMPAYQTTRVPPFSKEDVFVGFDDDTPASAILSVPGDTKFEDVQNLLLRTATMEGVFRLHKSKISDEAERWRTAYLENQSHDSLLSLLSTLVENNEQSTFVKSVDIVTFGNVLREKDRENLEKALKLHVASVMLLSLQQFKTCDEFARRVKTFLALGLAAKSTEGVIPLHVLLIQCQQSHDSAELAACAKHTVQNLLSQSEHTNVKGSRLVIAFLHALERGRVGNHLKSFFSARSNLIYVDELRVTSEYIAFPSKLWKTSLHAIFDSGLRFLKAENDGDGNGDDSHDVTDLSNNSEIYLHLGILIRNCISAAIVKLCSNEVTRDSERLRKILELFVKQGVVSTNFVCCVAQQIVNIMRERETTASTANSWIVGEACSQNALKEGGSFIKTLWIYLKKLTSNALAYIISKADVDQNLNILWDKKETNFVFQLKELWLKLFDLPQICGFRWRDLIGHGNDVSFNLEKGFNARFPFSRSIFIFFNKHWDALQCVEDQVKESQFHKQLTKTRLSKTLHEAESSCCEDILKAFVHDLVCLQYRKGSEKQVEAQLVENVLYEVFKKKQQEMQHSTSNISNLPACIFVLLKTEYHSLKQMEDISSIFPNIITQENSERWIATQKGQSRVVTQFAMFGTALKHLENQLLTMKNTSDYHQWTNLICQLKSKTHTFHVTALSDTDEKLWKALEFADLLLDQMISKRSMPCEYDPYVEFMIHLSKGLFKGAARSGLHTSHFLKIIVTNLSGYSKKISLNILLDWKNVKCKRCSKPTVVDPVILQCGHFMCYDCISAVTTREKKCPLCKTEICEEIIPAALTPTQVNEVGTFKANCVSFFLEYLSTMCFPASNESALQFSVDKQIVDTLYKMVILRTKTNETAPFDTSLFNKAPTVRSFILQLLLHYNPKQIEDSLETYFSNFSSLLDDKVELMMMCIRCIEDALQDQYCEVTSVLSLLESQTGIFTATGKLTQVQHLKIAANLRFTISNLCNHIYKCIRKENTKGLSIVTTFAKYVEDANIAKEYFVKYFCRRYGARLFSSLLTGNHASVMIPDNLLHLAAPLTDETNMLDTHFSSGEVYGRSLDILHSASSRNEVEIANTLIDLATHSKDAFVQVMLATLSFVDAQHRLGNADHLIETVFEGVSCETTDVALVIQLFQVLKNKDTCHLESNFTKTTLDALIADVCFTSCSVNCPLVKEFGSMVLNPSFFDTMFLPSMPQASYFEEEVRKVVGKMKETFFGGPPKEYLCPNGHLYFIGDCTNPVFVNLLCPDCKLPIGGLYLDGHEPPGNDVQARLLPGNKPGKLDEQSQAGYRLTLIEATGTCVVPERECTRASICVLRFMLHASMSISAKRRISISR